MSHFARLLMSLGLLLIGVVSGAPSSLALSIEWTTSPNITDSQNGISMAPELSPNVEIKYIASSNQYAIGSRNTSGNKSYAVNTAYTGLFMLEGIDNDFSSASEDFSAWKMLGD